MIQTEATAQFAPIKLVENYLPLEDHGLIGDGSTAALVARDGAISWFCLPRFDSAALFCRILDRERGGAFIIAPEGLREARQYYVGESGVLVTEMRGPEGVVRVTDMLGLRDGASLREHREAGRQELLRSVQVLHGKVRLQVLIEPRGGAAADRRGSGLRLRAVTRPELDLQLTATRQLEGTRTTLDLEAGDTFDVILSWGGGPYHHAGSPTACHDETIAAWERWLKTFHYDGPQTPLVRRSAITIKMLDYFPNGSIVAAPTSSLPETIGGERNWDYRYAWIRDCAFSVYALHRVGLSFEASGFLGWVLDQVERHGQPKILYTLDGDDPEPEWQDPGLEGYRASPPVRWGNAAADQMQNDVYGEIVDCAYQWASHHGEIDEHLWKKLRDLIDAARDVWRRPDHGIWEVRTPGRTFTYSAAICHVALDRGAKLAERLKLNGDIAQWRETADEIRETILKEGWDEKRQSITEHLGGGALDASLLTLPLRRVLPADHPKMIATTEAIRRDLGVGKDLIFRYHPSESPDGLEGDEGAFLLCSFWLVDNLARQGKLDEAMEIYESLCNRANPLGLLSEQIDPPTGAFLGNFPQAFSHVGVISSGVNLQRSLELAKKR